MRLVLKNLPIVVKDGSDLEARGQMQLAASMGATAFQKGLGMIHSLAHPLSSECGMHHGLANALMLPKSLEYLEAANLNADQKHRFARVMDLFVEFRLAKHTLSESCEEFFKSLGIQFGLKNHNVKKEQIPLLAEKAFKDPCHQCNMIPVTQEVLRDTYEKAFS
jgi:alcohol dehydrogenase class IV